MVAPRVVTSSVPRWDQPPRDWDRRRSTSLSVTRTLGSVTLGTVMVTPSSALGSHLERWDHPNLVRLSEGRSS